MRHLEIPPGLTERLNEGALGPLLHGFRAAFLLALAALLVLLWRERGPGRSRGIQAGISIGLAVAFFAVWAHQARWQLAGFADPRFVTFLRRYDRRPDAGAARPRRGRILDARGEELARDDPDQPGRRVYPAGAAAAHPVGFLNPRFGVYGLESAADGYLGGTTLATPDERRRFGRNLIGGEPARGNDLRLTIDLRLQRAAAAALSGCRGAIVALRPSDGAVLALASAPAFDPEDPAAALAADPEEAPMLNRALHGLYPPGSSFKIVTAALSVEAGDRPVLDCAGEGFVPAPGTRPIRDHEYYAAQREGRDWPGHGRLGLGEAFARSSNVYFAQAGVRATPARWAEMLGRVRTGDAPALYAGSDGQIAARAGTVFAADDLHAGRRAQLAIGQGDLLVSPLHMALIAAAVANDGWAWAPRLDAAAPRAPLGRFFRPGTARELRALLRDAVRHGTGRRAAPAGVEVAGKTGTAQNPRGEDHAWFVGFAPAERPALAFAVLVEHGGSGGSAAAPRAAELVGAAAACGLLAVPAAPGAAP